MTGNQTNQRAELTAFLKVIEGEERSMVVFTDSTYVQLGVTKWRKEWKDNAWYRNAGKVRWIDNVDLWNRVDGVMEQRGEEIHVKWVKGHAMPWHIRSGLTTEFHTWGNNMVDIVAGKAAEETGVNGVGIIRCKDV